MQIDRITFHPAYLANRDHYQRHRDWLESTPEALAKYLVQTYLEIHDGDEGKEAFQERVDLLDTSNSIHSLLTIHHSELTKEQPRYSGMDSDQAQKILQDIDGKRQSAWKLAKEIFWQILWAGFAPVETFAPPKSGERKIDALLSGERSYSRLYEPDDLVAWDYFDDDGPMRGQLRMVAFHNRVCTVEKKRSNELYQTYKVLWIDGPGETYRSQIVKAKKSIFATAGADYVDVEPDPDPDRGEERVGELQYLPVTFFGDPVEGVKHTVMFRAAYRARIKLNKQSHYDTTTRYNHYPRHIISGSRDAKQDALHAGNTSVGVVEGDVKVHTLEAADPVALWRDIQRLEQEIRQEILVQPHQSANPESREVPSVDSKRADAEARKKLYEDITDEVQFGLEYLFGWAHAGFEVGDIPKDEVGVTFPRDFSLKDYETELQEQTLRWNRSGSMGKAGTKFRKRLFINDVLKARIEVVEDENEEEIRKEIIDEVLKQPDEEFGSELATAFNRREALMTRLRGDGEERDEEEAEGEPRDGDE